MEPKTLLNIILGITITSYALDQLLEYLNLRHQRNDIPSDIEAFYQREKYHKALAYHRETSRFSFLTSAISFAASVTLLLTGGFGWLDTMLRTYIENDIVLALVFFGIIMILSDVLTTPFQLYSTFVIEEKYGFNKTTISVFLADKLKGYALTALVGTGLMSLFIVMVEKIGPQFWMWFSVVAAAFILLVNMFYTSLILPLFNKLTPLPEGELRNAIESFSQKVHFPLDSVFIIDGSKRSKKANAFFSGIGKKKKIVLYDTLIQNHTTDELVAVLAHEVGHFKKKHIVYGYMLSLLQIAFTLFILSRMVYSDNISLALGGTQSAIHLNLIAFGILFSPISAVTGILMKIFSRKNEYEADAYARQQFNAKAMSDALKKLSVDSLSELYPHPAYVFFHYSHPPLMKRLAALSDSVSNG